MPQEPADDGALLTFAQVMRRLRAECPWKQEQTHRSLSRYLLEETYETLEAIDAGHRTGDWAHLREELGDLLLQVYFHAVIGEESGAFTLGDVAADVTEKMRRRNPHVFGQTPPGDGTTDAAEVLDAATVNEMWERAKATEKDRTSPLEGLPPGLPALLLADKVLDRLDRRDRRAGRHTNRRLSPTARMTSEAGVGSGGSSAEAIGERLLALVAEARAGGVDPEQALRDAVGRLTGPDLDR